MDFWRIIKMDQQQSSLWLSNDNFTTDEPLFDNVNHYCFDEPIFAESISDSSDSGNYSPSLTECNSNVFDLENPKYWQNSLESSIDGHCNNVQFSNEFLPQHEINYPNNTFVHQTSETPIASQQFIKPVIPVPNGNMVFVVKKPNFPSKPIALQPVTHQVLLPAQQTQHPIKAEARVMPSTSLILPTAAFTPKIQIAQDNTEEDNDFYKKKEERKMRNRAAAQLSRQRKKNEEINLKKELEDTNKRCTELEKENEKLKIRIRQLEYENKKLLEMNGADLTLAKTKVGDIRHKNAAKTGAVVCMLLFTWMILPDFNTNEPQKQLLLENKFPQDKNDHSFVIGHGRLLQSTNTTYGRTKNFSAHSRGINDTLNNNGTFDGCGRYSNRFYNESLKIKLSEDLLTWIGRHEILELELPQLLRHGKLQPMIKTNNAEHILPKIRINNNDFDAEQNNENRIKHRNKGSEREDRIRNGMRRKSTYKKQEPINKSMRDLRRVIGIPSNNNGSRSFFSRHQMSKLMKSIKGNGETEQNNILFLIPMLDYLLLPPSNIHENSTIQLPKLSIILPALSPPLNSSEPFNQLAMIRIDADIIGTKFFYLQEKLIKSLLKVQTLATI